MLPMVTGEVASISGVSVCGVCLLASSDVVWFPAGEDCFANLSGSGSFRLGLSSTFSLTS